MKQLGILLSIIFMISAKAQDKKNYSFTLPLSVLQLLHFARLMHFHKFLQRV